VSIASCLNAIAGTAAGEKSLGVDGRRILPSEGDPLSLQDEPKCLADRPGPDRRDVATWETVMAGGSQLLEQGLFEEIGWVGNLEGYGLLEADPKAAVIGLVNGFFPYFNQEIMEFTPHAEAGPAHVAGAKMAAQG
jgi:hypothetical protein